MGKVVDVGGAPDEQVPVLVRERFPHEGNRLGGIFGRLLAGYRSALFVHPPHVFDLGNEDRNERDKHVHRLKFLVKCEADLPAKNLDGAFFFFQRFTAHDAFVAGPFRCPWLSQVAFGAVVIMASSG